MNKLHRFSSPVMPLALPEKFTCPFHYTPHPFCRAAAEEVQKYLQENHPWRSDSQQGKMFGVLVVQTPAGEVGFLAAFSGMLAGSNRHSYFVPPIYDLQQPQGFFRLEEERISIINTRIKQLQTATSYLTVRQRLSEATALAATTIATAQKQFKEARQKREEKRSHSPGEEALVALIQESQFQKAELKRLKQQWNEQLLVLQTEIDTFEQEIERLKTERKTRSAALQQLLFEQFRIRNGKGEIKNLCDIFRETVQQVPPAGAGECAAPRLLQYAYLHNLKPLAMAEFWWGCSPGSEIRHHGYFYPACKGKCEPILNYMLQGLSVEDNPLEHVSHCYTALEIVFEDDWLLVVNKPAGMLSVPGKTGADSVWQRMKRLYPDATGPLIVHRLDMATSGLLLIAKTKEVHQHLQAQFKNRTVEKRYMALLDGVIAAEEGSIDLPLAPDPLDRPRQIVSKAHGKPAITTYRVLARSPRQTSVAFYPLTGRTHQLRVHAAHPLGLGVPIVGDELYGKAATRLCLHAEFLAFRHPITGERLQVEKKPDPAERITGFSFVFSENFT